MTSPSGTARAVPYGLLPVTVLGATLAIEAAERMALAQAVDGIQAEFGISDTAVGLLPAAMIVVGVLGALVIGVLADRVRRTRLLGAALGIWTLGMVGSAAAPGYGPLFAARLAVGAVEGNGPAAVSLLGDYYPVRRRARMFGLYHSGALVGSLVGLLAGGVAVSAGGWRWAFWIWVPAGLAVAVWVWRTVEPARGSQDSDLGLQGPVPVGASLDAPPELDLPPAPRVGTLDYRRAGLRAVLAELLRIRTMWFALVGVTIGYFLLLGLQFWVVEFFKRAHGASPTAAGGFAAVFGLGAAAGVLLGGFACDRVLARGVVNARIYVIASASLAAPLVLVPAFLVRDVWLALPLFLVGGVLLTTPVAPGEAALNEVIPAPLRGRAASVRGVVRSFAALSPVAIGLLSDAVGLRTAVAAITPVYALGGLVILLAARTYPGDLAFVAAEAQRLENDQQRLPGG